MKILIKLLLVSSVLLSFNTAHAFWGDGGDKYVTISKPIGDSGVTSFDLQLKNIKSSKYHKGLYIVYDSYTPSHSGYLGWVVSSKEIEMVKKYLKKK